MADRISYSCKRSHDFANHRDADRGNGVANNRDPRGIEIDCLLQRVRECELHGFVNRRNADRGNDVFDNRDDPLRNVGINVELLEFHGRLDADELLDCQNKIVVDDDVDDIGLPQYDEAEYAEDDVGPLLIWRQTYLSPLTEYSNSVGTDNLSSMSTVQGKVCHFIIDACSRKNVLVESIVTIDHPKSYKLLAREISLGNIIEKDNPHMDSRTNLLSWVENDAFRQE